MTPATPVVGKHGFARHDEIELVRVLA